MLQNYVSASNQPINSLVTTAAPGQVITIWGTGLGPVTFPDNVAPTPGNVATPVTVTIGGQPATVAYSGRAPCCAGLDQIVATVPKNAPLGCWVPVSINAGGVVSNTTTMAIAAAGATACNDPGNPLSTLVQTPGTQAFIHVEQVNDIENIDTATPVTQALDYLYARFYTRPNSPFNFDPYMSYPPAGTCLVHQTTGDSSLTLSLRGALAASASLSPQPNQTYNNGTQSVSIPPTGPLFAEHCRRDGRLNFLRFEPVERRCKFHHRSWRSEPSGSCHQPRAAACLDPAQWNPRCSAQRSPGSHVHSRGYRCAHGNSALRLRCRHQFHCGSTVPCPGRCQQPSPFPRIPWRTCRQLSDH